MDSSQTVIFICGIITCIIGIATFITGMMTRARKDGQIAYKVDEALNGIAEIKETLNKHLNWQNETSLDVRSHDEQIKMLFSTTSNLDTRLTRLEDSILGRLEQ